MAQRKGIRIHTPKQAYGKTWWGQQFLKALDDIDFDNRLPRGKSYANKGAVSTLEYAEKQVIASVEGSRAKPYKVRIVFQPFSAKGSKGFIREISEQPELVSRLLNMELNPSIHAIAETQGLKLFPEKWSDLKMQCSCPDWAVPCKHIAAVIYRISSEIDQNPLLLFELHGLDLRKTLQEKGLQLDTDTQLVEKMENLYPAKRKKTGKPIVPEVKTHKPVPLPPLPSLLEPITSLMDPNPLFHIGAGDFREIYIRQLKNIAKIADRLLTGRMSPEALLKTKPRWKHAIHAHSVMAMEVDQANHPYFIGDKNLIPFIQLSEYIFGKETQEHSKRHPSQRFLHDALIFSLQLLSSGTVVPRVMEMPSGKYGIRWLPAMLHPQIRSTVKSIAENIPDDFLGLEDGPPVAATPVEMTTMVLSLMLNELTGLISLMSDLEPMARFFFQGTVSAFSKPGEREIPSSIHGWLQRFHFFDSPYRIQLQVTEMETEDFCIDIMLEEAGNSMSTPFPASELFAKKKYDGIRLKVLQSLTRLSGFIPKLEEYLRNKGRTPVTLTLKELPDFLLQMVPAMQLMDIPVLLPASLRQLHRPKATVRIKSEGNNARNFSMRDMLAFDWQIAIGDETIDEKTFQKLTRKAHGLIRIKSGYMYAGPEEIEKINRELANKRTFTPSELLTFALTENFEGAPVMLTAQVKELIRKLTEYPEVSLPKGLVAKLRPYQERGFSWMWRNTQIGFGSILADDMGLGKTLQVITTILKFKEEDALETERVLIVAPTGLLTNWQAEFERFAPGLQVMIHHGSQRKLPMRKLPDVIITSYGVLRSDAGLLRKCKWKLLVIDEAQNIKNTGTEQSKAVKSMPASHFIAMSGTPVENRLSELWSIMDFSNRGLLGKLDHFSEQFARPIQQFNDAVAVDRLKKVCAPFLLRRMKTDKSIIADLPDKIEIDCYARLNPAQTALYQKTLDESLAAVAQVEGKDHRSLFRRQGIILQMILVLKQICNHPTQFLKNRQFDPSLSGKTDLLFDKLDSILALDEKVLIFTQFTEMGDLLVRFLKDRYAKTPLFYHGGLGLKARKEMVAAFQSDPERNMLILSLKAGGTGLNLTSACHVIHYDLWWNPAVEAQATDRAFRIGQTKDVTVHRFITKDSFEERINNMIQQKKSLAQMTVASGEQWIGQLSNAEILEIFRLG